jgi:hypothetical protein
MADAEPKSSGMPGARYEPVARVVTAFFAALIGFGIKNLLDVPAHPNKLLPFRIPCFLIAVLLFLRYLTGSASHLWLEYIKHDDPKRPWFFAFDIGFLILFGMIALMICYTEDLLTFFCWSATLNVSAICWGGIRECFKPHDHGDWLRWAWIDGIHAFFFVFGSFVVFVTPPQLMIGRFTLSLWLWVLMSGFLFGWDLKVQLDNLEKAGA